MADLVELDTSIVIVGGGPVGLGLAIELGLRGIPCVVLERFHDVQRIPKGQHLTQRTLEHFYSWGIERQLRAARIIPAGWGIGGVTAHGTLLSGYQYDWLQRDLVNAFYFQANERLPQYQMEMVLRKRVAELPAVKVLFGRRAERIEQSADGVMVWTTEQDNGAQLGVRATYAVGCDGSGSMVREQAGIRSTRRDHDRRMVLLVFKSTTLATLLPERFQRKSFFSVLNPELKGYWQFFGRVDADTTWFFHSPVPPETTRENFDCHGYLSAAVGADFDVDIEYAGFWDLRIAIADTYSAGRIFIAGDAAHSHPPYGAYGVNTGFEDVKNLGWKLAATLQGWAGDRLLDSYTEERQPVFESTARDFIERAIESDRLFLRDFDPTRDQSAFDHEWAARAAGARLEVDQFEPNYEGSSLIEAGADTRPSAKGLHSFLARAGHHLAPYTLSSGRNVFEELGENFSLLSFAQPPEASESFRRAAQELGLPLTIIEDGTSGAEFYHASLVLVRPDQFVAWSGSSAPRNVSQILKRAVGARHV